MVNCTGILFLREDAFMKCKFCNAELEEGITLCPECGKENLEEIQEETLEIVEEQLQEPVAEEICQDSETAEENPPKRKQKVWMIVLAAIGALALLAVLAGAVFYGVGAWVKRANSYTVAAEKADSVRDTVVANVGTVELTNNQLQVYYRQSINEFLSYYGSYLDASVLDMSKPLDTQFYDQENGVTWQKYFLDTALTTWSRYAALCAQAQDEGLPLSEEMESYLAELPSQLDVMAATYGYETVAAMLEADMGALCDVNGYMDYMRTVIYAGQYLDAKYENLIPNDQEIADYYSQNEATLAEMGIVNDGSITVDVRHILICPKGGTTADDGSVTYSEEEWEQCRAEAQALLDQWLAEDGTEEGFAKLAGEHTEDPGSMSTGGLYTDVYVGQMVPPFEDWCFDTSRTKGDSGLVQTTYGYHIMYFAGSEEIWVTNVRDTIINERSLAMVDEAAAKWPMEANYKKIALGEILNETAE